MEARPTTLRAPLPPLVSVTVTADSLHLLAHRAQLGARTAEDWWDNALDTALAAVSATRHPLAFRSSAQAAVRRLDRWWREGQARHVSADATALALAARASADLAARNRDLERAAVEAVSDLASRTGAAAPALHVALSAWALDPLVADRDAAPWVSLRTHLNTAREGSGLDGPLRVLSRAIATPQLDPGELVRELLARLPSSPGAEDAAVLLWTMTAAIERCATEMSQTDSGLRALIDRRAELTSRLSHEITAETFEQPAVDDFDPDTELDVRPISYLSLMEALLLDMALASAEPEDAWIRFEEGERLFGHREREMRRVLVTRTAKLLAVLGLAVGSLVGVVTDWLGADLSISLAAALAIGWMLWLAATTVLHRARPRPLTQALGLLWATLGLASACVALNYALEKPLLGDLGGFVAGALIGVFGAALWQLSVASSHEP